MYICLYFISCIYVCLYMYAYMYFGLQNTASFCVLLMIRLNVVDVHSGCYHYHL